MRFIRRVAAGAVLAGVASCCMVAQNPNTIFYHTPDQQDESAATQGDASAHVRLGYRYLTGATGTVDTTQAARNFAAAAQKGSLASSAWLGYTYVTSPELGHQASEGIALIQNAASSGDPVAQTLLGHLQDLGTGVAQNHDAARTLFEGSAPVFALAQTYLGEWHVRSNTAQDYAIALQLFNAAAVQNDTRAMVDLAMLYVQGKGVQQDGAAARQWLAEAAKWGDLGAIFRQGYLYRHAPGKVNNPGRAVALYQQAAARGYVPAEAALGMCYLWGLGVQKDVAQAVKWLSMAAPEDPFAARQLAAIKA